MNLLKVQHKNDLFLQFFRITMTEVECFDPLSNEWSLSQHLPESRSEAGAVII